MHFLEEVNQDYEALSKGSPDDLEYDAALLNLTAAFELLWRIPKEDSGSFSKD
jgi:hypothetical protein